MKNKLLLGIACLLLASSTMFAGWGVGFGAAVFGAPGVVYAAPVQGYYYHRWVAPYVGTYVPAPYAPPCVPAAPYIDAYVGPPPFYGAIWIPGRWVHGPHGRYWATGYWGHRHWPGREF